MPLKYIAFFTLILISVIVNYGMSKKIIDQIQMVTVVSYDYVDDDSIEGTVVTPTFMQQGQLTDLIYTDKASLIYENRSKLNREASEDLINGKLEVALFNEELAKRGLEDYIDNLLRDPSIGSRLFIAVVEGSTSELLKTIKSKKGAGVYLSDLFEHNIKKESLPTTNLKLFNYGLECKTCDPFLPLLKIERGIPKLESIALFKDDKYIDTISMEQSFVFGILYENMDSGNYALKTDEYKASIQNIDANKRIKVDQEQGDMNITITINIEGVVREYTKKGVQKNKGKIKKDFEKELEKKAKDMIKGFQEQNIDPLGIKEHVRGKMRDMSVDQIEEGYPSFHVNVSITYTNLESGTRR